MAQVYATPDGFPPPELDFSMGVEAYFDALREWEGKLAAWCRENYGDDDLIGFVYRWPVADGKASYMVMQTRPLSLLWLDGDDGYDLPEAHLRGLRVSDLREAKRRDDTLAELFGRKAD